MISTVTGGVFLKLFLDRHQGQYLLIKTFFSWVLTHLYTHLLTHLLTHSLIHLLTHSLTHIHTHTHNHFQKYKQTC